MGFFRGRTITTRANKLSEFTVNTAEYGATVPEVLGTVRMAGNVIYHDDFTAHEHKETHRAGKGGKSKSVSITYTYTAAVILGLCEGPISGIGEVWKDKEVYTYPSDEIGLTLFKGADDQQPWAYTMGRHPDKALPYKGLAYMAGVIDLGESGAMPSFNFEIKGKLLETGDGVDVNPADYVRYVLDRTGLKDVEIEGLDNYRRFCRESDLLISTPQDEDAKAAREVINDIMGLTNAYMFWSNDRFKIVCLSDRPAGNWEPNRTIVADLTADDFIPQNGGALVTFQRKDSSEMYNQFPVEFINRAGGYEKESVTYELKQDIADYGVRAANTKQAHYIYTKARAVKVAEQLARNNLYGRNRYTFKLDWSWSALEIGDLVRLTDAYSGIDKQIAVIDSVTEGADGLLTITAISRAEDTHDKATYNIKESLRPTIDFNAPPPDTNPVIFQPPADLTDTGLSLWIAANGKDKNWGGCYVYVSDDNEHYREAGQIASSARTGKLMESMAKDADTLTAACTDVLLSGSPQDAERANTLCWVDGEALSYETATLTAANTYKLDGLKRGQYNTMPASHARNAAFVRLDNALLHLPFTKEDIGKKIYLKFPSYNIFGAAMQDLSRVQAYEYTLTAYYIPPVKNLTARNRYRQLADGVSRYDIVVNWEPPDLSGYLQGDVWYKTNNDQSAALTVKSGQKASELGYSGKWVFGGSGIDEVVIPQAAAGDTYLIAVCTKDKYGAVTGPDTAPHMEITVAIKTETPNTPDGFTIRFERSALASWEEVTNADIAFYELRTDTKPGYESDTLLARTGDLGTALPLTARQGTVYLYAKGAGGKYSAPAVYKYYKKMPRKPNPPILQAVIGGFGVAADTIPNGANGMNVYINGQAVHTENNTLSHTCKAGIYDVSVAYTDIFGEGEKSEPSRVIVKETISGDMLDSESISLSKVDGLIKKKLESGEMARQETARIVSSFSDLETAKANYSAFSQMTDAINLRVVKGDVINQINLSPTTTTIDGKYLHVTGKTVFDDNVIAKGMIQAGAITADKLDVTNLSAITAKIGTLRTATSGARTEIKDNLIEVYDSNNRLRVRIGVWQ